MCFWDALSSAITFVGMEAERYHHRPYPFGLRAHALRCSRFGLFEPNSMLSIQPVYFHVYSSLTNVSNRHCYVVTRVIGPSVC